MVLIREEATDNALKYLMSNIEKRKFDTSLHRESNFECVQKEASDDNDEGEEGTSSTMLCYTLQ